MLIFFGLGSNLGDRESHLRRAASGLAQPDIKLVRSASIYLTEPRDYADQPWFLNTVIQADTDLPAGELLERCLALEREAGRVRVIPNGPRNIDIDILLYGALVVDAPKLTIPHPRYAERRFTLAPLMEIAPDFVDPRRGTRIRDLFDACQDPAVVEIYGPPLL